MKRKNVIIAGVAGLVAAAAAVFYFKKRKDNGIEKPPKNAPQLNIDNPGDQSEFKTSATESEIG